MIMTKEKKEDLKEQLKSLKTAAKRRGLVVRHDKGLKDTPYRAMNPRAARSEEVDQCCPKNAILFESKYLPEEVMDIRHEILEYDKMGKPHWKYKRAHKFANRKQRTVGAENIY